MQFVSFLMSVVMLVVSLAFTSSKDVSQRAEAVEQAVASLFDNTGSLFEEETGDIVEAIVRNILIECLTNESESLELYEIADKIPVFEDGVRDGSCQDVTSGPFGDSFRALLSTVAEDETVASGAANNILEMIKGGVYELYIYLIPAEEEGLYIFCYDFVDGDGNVHTKRTNTRFNKNTGDFYGVDGKGILGIGFDCDIDNYLVTTPVYAWQRSFGYSVFYDVAGEMGFMNTEMLRIKFEHGGKQWMFQLWKGNYSFGLANGAEIGIYNKKSPLSLMYDCASDEEMLDMTMNVSYNGETIIERDATRHWWLCGLCFGTPIPPEEIVFEGTVEFTDEEMMAKFIESAEKYSDELTVSASGNTVEYIWK